MSNQPSDPHTPEDELSALLSQFGEREEKAVESSIPHQQEATRSIVTLIIVIVFATTVVVFTVTAACIIMWGDIGRLETMTNIVQTISGVISPVVTFILGYYFATKNNPSG